MIVTTNSTEGGIYEVLPCSLSLLVGLQQESIYFSAVNIFLSITAFLGNFLILVALNKGYSHHPPSKLLYRCVATTNLLVRFVRQLLAATYWMSLVHEHRSLFWYARDTVYISSYALCSVSLFTLMAISVDRLPAQLLEIRSSQTDTVKVRCEISRENSLYLLQRSVVHVLLSCIAEKFEISLIHLICNYSITPSCWNFNECLIVGVIRTARCSSLSTNDHANTPVK